MPKGRQPRVPRSPAWQAYWSDNHAPHPDAVEAQRRPMAKTERVLAPIRKGALAHYCHHYRLANEHYHSSMEELERCEK